MASEIRVNQIQSRSGLGTVTFGDSGIIISGITTISELRTNSIVPVGGIPAGASGGGIIQVVSTTKTDTFSSATSSSAFIDVTGLSVSITPRSTSNKILIYSTVHITGNNALDRFGIRLVRDSTAIAIADAASNRVRASATTINESTNDLHNLNIMHLDSPSTTSATTYKIQCTNESNRNVYINRSNSDSDNNTIFRAVSSITAMEVSG